MKINFNPFKKSIGHRQSTGFIALEKCLLRFLISLVIGMWRNAHEEIEVMEAELYKTFWYFECLFSRW